MMIQQHELLFPQNIILTLSPRKCNTTRSSPRAEGDPINKIFMCEKRGKLPFQPSVL